MGFPHIEHLVKYLVEVTLLLSDNSRDIFDVLTLIIAAASLVVSALGVGLTYWLVSVVQNGINNRRLLKDHYIREVLELRLEYFDLFRSLQNGQINPKNLPYRFQQISIRVDDLMPGIKEDFCDVTEDLSAYHLEIFLGIEAISEYQAKYRANKKVFANKASKEALQELQRCSIGTFNSIIRQINGSK